MLQGINNVYSIYTQNLFTVQCIHIKTLEMYKNEWVDTDGRYYLHCRQFTVSLFYNTDEFYREQRFYHYLHYTV